MRHTKGFSCAPGSGFFARCPSCTRLLIFGQTCVCGTYSGRSINPTVDLARKVKAGRLTRNSAIQCYRELNKCAFMDALMAIDIAIGDINEGNV